MINEGKCLDINFENIMIKKTDETLLIGSKYDYSLNQIRETCENCANNPS